MTEMKDSSSKNEDAAVIAGAIGGYLGHNKFKIISIKENDKEVVSESESEEVETTKSFFSFIPLWRPKKG